jgi:hypothetical protein
MPCRAAKSLSATNIATHHHLSCDLYLHYVYHGCGVPEAKGVADGPSEFAKAHFERGLGWEGRLYAWLDEQGLLSTIMSGPMDGKELRALLELEDRDYFFLTGVSFWPPNAAFALTYEHNGLDPVRFGLAKPDLVEFKRQEDGIFVWRVLDAKASKEMKVRTVSSPLRCSC